MYIYESHLGDLYAMDEALDYESLYCENCGDADKLIGYASNSDEAFELLKKNGWREDYIYEFISEYFCD